VTIYSDGSRRQLGGYAGLMTQGQNSIVVYGNEPHETSNAMEMQAVISCVAKLKIPCNVEIACDSTYTENSINKWIKDWKRRNWHTAAGQPPANLERVMQLSNQAAVHNMKARHVPGHSGHPENELVDWFAGRAADNKI